MSYSQEEADLLAEIARLKAELEAAKRERNNLKSSYQALAAEFDELRANAETIAKGHAMGPEIRDALEYWACDELRGMITTLERWNEEAEDRAEAAERRCAEMGRAVEAAKNLIDVHSKPQVYDNRARAFERLDAELRALTPAPQIAGEAKACKCIDEHGCEKYQGEFPEGQQRG